MSHAGARLRRSALLGESRRRQQADCEVRAGPFEVQRVQVECVEPARDLEDLLDAVVPRPRRIGLIEAADVRHVLPQPFERFLAVELRIDQ